MDMYTLLYLRERTNKELPYRQHRELYSMSPLWGSLDGRRVGGEWTHVYVCLSHSALH